MSPESEKCFPRIDTHAHFVPPCWREACLKHGHEKPDGMPAIPPWNEEEHLNMMQKANISKSILSITSPGTNLVPSDVDFGRDLTRQTNEYAADLKRRYPDKFGFWASLPLPDVEGSLMEIDYALDELNADGFTLLTNSHGVYLGDPRLDPVFKALNERKATIFVHPTSPCNGAGCGGHSSTPLKQYPNPMFEFFFDTARAIINMIITGTIDNSPNLTIIIPHAGGAIAPLVPRIAEFANSVLGLPTTISIESVKTILKSQFYFDLAGFALPEQLQGLLAYTNETRLLYGSDYPFTPESGALKLVEKMDKELVLVFPSPQARMAILSRNAERLLNIGCSKK